LDLSLEEGHLQLSDAMRASASSIAIISMARGARQYKVRSHGAFGSVLPRIGASEADLRRRRLDKEKVLATIVRLLETTLIRVGNEEYAKQYGSFGLTR